MTPDTRFLWLHVHDTTKRVTKLTVLVGPNGDTDSKAVYAMAWAVNDAYLEDDSITDKWPGAIYAPYRYVLFYDLVSNYYLPILHREYGFDRKAIFRELSASFPESFRPQCYRAVRRFLWITNQRIETERARSTAKRKPKPFRKAAAAFREVLFDAAKALDDVVYALAKRLDRTLG